MLLRFHELLGREDIELDVHAVHGEVGPDEVHQLLAVRVGLQDGRHKFLVEVDAVGGKAVVDARHGFRGRRRAEQIHAVLRGDAAVAERRSGFPAAGQRADLFAERGVGGKAEQAGTVAAAGEVPVAAHGPAVMIADHRDHGVRLLDVVAVLGRPVQQDVAQQGVRLEIRAHALQQVFLRNSLLVKHKALDRGQGVAHIRDAHALNADEIVLRAALGAVAPALHAAVQQHAAVDVRRVVAVELLDRVEGADHHADKVFHLGLIGLLQVFEGLEIRKFSGLRAHLLPGHLADAVEHGQFKALGQVEVAAVGPAHRVAVGRRLHAADDGVVAGVLQGDAVVQQGRDDDVIVEEGKLAALLLHQDLQHALDELLRVFRGEADAGVGLGIKDGAFRLQAQVGQLVDGVVSVLIHAAQHEVDRGGEAAVVLGAGVGAGLDDVALLDPEGLQQLLRLLLHHRAVFDVLLIVGVEHLVHTAAGDGGAVLSAVVDQDGEPVGLQRLIEGLRRLPGHAAAVRRDQAKLGGAARIALLFGHFQGQIRIAASEDAHAFADDQHGAVEIPLVDKLRIHQVQGLQLLLRLRLDRLKAVLHDLLNVGQIVAVAAARAA